MLRIIITKAIFYTTIIWSCTYSQEKTGKQLQEALKHCLYSEAQFISIHPLEKKKKRWNLIMKLRVSVEIFG